MGAGASMETPPYTTAEEALAAGKTQEEIDAYVAQKKVADDAAAASAEKPPESPRTAEAKIEAPAAAGDKTPKFVYLPVVGRGEQIHLLAAEHGFAFEFVKPKGFGGEYVWQESAPHGTVPVFECAGEDAGLILSDSAAIIDYILEKTPEGPFTPKDARSRVLARDTWMFCQDYYNHFLSPMHDSIMGHAEPHWRQGRNTDPRADKEHAQAADYLSELATYHTQRMARLEKKLVALGSAFSAGDAPTYADLFVYTCVNTVLKCKGFTAFRESCGEKGPFDGCPTVLALAAKIGEREKIKAMAGKFDQAPV
jgi:glutathione S-transferase